MNAIETKTDRTPIEIATDIAAGRTAADPSASGHNIRGAMKDLNCKGRGPEWYRLVYRSGNWRYVSNDHLPRGTYLASDRQATVYGQVYSGEIVANHDRGGPVDQISLVCDPDEDRKLVLVSCPFAKRRDGQLGITLPDGTEIVLPNPCKS